MVRNKLKYGDDIGIIVIFKKRICINQIIDNGIADDIKIINRNEHTARKRLE
jgi:hypothetical protein